MAQASRTKQGVYPYSANSIYSKKIDGKQIEFGGKHERKEVDEQMEIESKGIETKDLWQSAYVLSEGGKLEDVRINRRNGHKEVIFILGGMGVKSLIRTFQSGQALCNVTRLKASMSHLKDVMFQHIER